jgi:hypothetical protein
MSHQGLSATWLKDNKPLDGSVADRAKIVAKENHFTLELAKTVSGDSGQYTCRVTSPSGEAATCSAQLEVHECKPRESSLRAKVTTPAF